MGAPAQRVAIVAQAGRFPDGPDHHSFLANLMEGRRAFRTIPPDRIDLAAYSAEAIGDADSITPIRAGLLTDWRFDRRRFRIPEATYEVTDLTHWLALETAAEAVSGLGPDGLPQARTAVVVANTLTGEFSRGEQLRLRLPFLAEALAESAGAAGAPELLTGAIIDQFAQTLRRRFPAPNEESLAGGLANTIAGRIANFFDLRGGAYAVDGACASSLLAIGQGFDLLATHRADAVVVAAVDLSIDPFELVGFSRNDALSRGEMRVFDARSSGFWPGEGAGCVVLMREAYARRRRLPVEAFVRGWGLSTDGAGGLTRPTVEGQASAIRRACESAGIDPVDLEFVEAHGTGTPTGDPIEVRALASVRNGARVALPIGSVKANIGHCKAAAGLAGLLKAVGCLRQGLLAPHVGCAEPHPVFEEIGRSVFPCTEPRPLGGSGIAGVSGFGFGGVNVHVALEAPVRTSAPRARAGWRPSRDTELFLFAGATLDGLRVGLQRLADRAPSLSWSEVSDAAAAAAEVVQARPGRWRAAVVVEEPFSLSTQLQTLLSHMDRAREAHEPRCGYMFAEAPASAAIGLLFPGQSAPVRTDSGAWAAELPSSSAICETIKRDTAGASGTAIAQAAIAGSAIAGLQALAAFRIDPVVAVGHSVGELAALAWAGVIPEAALAPLAAARGRIMQDYATQGGGMLRVEGDLAAAGALTDGLGLALACENGSHEFILAGGRDALELAAARARSRGLQVQALAVANAFHSPFMAPALEPWQSLLQEMTFAPPFRRVFSTVKGDELAPTDDIAGLLTRQLVAPVRFASALDQARHHADLFIEVGGGAGLSRLAEAAGVRAVTLDVFGSSMKPLLLTLGAAFVAGAQPEVRRLFRGRGLRPIDVDARPVTLANRCGRLEASERRPLLPAEAPAAEEELSLSADDEPLLDIVRTITAEEAGLALDVVLPESRFLSDLHLNSLAVGRIISQVGRRLGGSRLSSPGELSDATAEDVAAAFKDINAVRAGTELDRRAGVFPWVRTYAMAWNACDVDVLVVRGAWRTASLDIAAAAAADSPAPLLVWVPQQFDAAAGWRLCEALQVAARSGVEQIAICHAGAPVSALVRSISLERRFRTLDLVDRGASGLDDRAVIGLGLGGAPFREVWIDQDGALFAPEFRPTEPRTRLEGPAPLGAQDVVFVTGGGRGIAAECALRLASAHGCALALCGRSPRAHPDVAKLLGRAAREGVRCAYFCADVNDPIRMRRAMAGARRRFGPVTVLIHAAGRNDPVDLLSLTREGYEAVVAPKTQGLAHALEAAGSSLSRAYVFGSIIGVIGLNGEAHYALANAMQSQILGAWTADHPAAVGLSIDWSVWGSVGMGERLGVLEGLARQGVEALSIDDALRAFESLVARNAFGSCVVTSRFGPPPQLGIGDTSLPSLRFVDEPVVHFPEVELVCETTISPGRDPYLADHRVEGRMILPGVMALEAMAQVASALSRGDTDVRRIAEVGYEQPISLPEQGGLRIRIAGLVLADGRVECCIRSEEDAFVAVRARATFGAPRRRLTRIDRKLTPRNDCDAASLYGPLFFHGERFHRISQILEISSRTVTARLSTGGGSWFATVEPQTLILGDPAVRDAALHVLQAAVLHRRVVPTGVSYIERREGGRAAVVRAREVCATPGRYAFDIEIEDDDGVLIERWSRAVFRAIGPLDVPPVLRATPQLMGAYLERLAREVLLQDDLCAAAVLGEAPARRGGDDRRDARLGLGPVHRRADGKPSLGGSRDLTLAHAGLVSLAVQGEHRVGCDLTSIAAFLDPNRRPDMGAWPVENATGSDEATHAARVWAIGETLRKLGRRRASALASHTPEAPLPPGAAVHQDEDGALVLTVPLAAPGGDLMAAIGIEAAQTSRGRARQRVIHA